MLEHHHVLPFSPAACKAAQHATRCCTAKKVGFCAVRIISFKTRCSAHAPERCLSPTSWTPVPVVSRPTDSACCGKADHNHERAQTMIATDPDCKTGSSTARGFHVRPNQYCSAARSCLGSAASVAVQPTANKTAGPAQQTVHSSLTTVE